MTMPKVRIYKNNHSLSTENYIWLTHYGFYMFSKIDAPSSKF